jgi:hypothetical protein
MASDRKDRIQESRNLHTRDSEIRRKLKMAYHDPLELGSYPKPDEVDYFRGRKSLRGEIDHQRIPELRRKGWEYVPADRHPDLIDPEDTKGYIETGGLVLMERHQEYGQIETETRDENNQMYMQSLPGLENFMNEPTMPMKVFENKTFVSPKN